MRFDDAQLLPFSVESVSLPRVNSFKLFLEVGGEVDGGVEVLPDEGVVLHVLDVVLLRRVARGQVAVLGIKIVSIRICNVSL